MNRLAIEKRAAILGMLVEGNSLRATSRLADVSINTVAKLLVDLGKACAEYGRKNIRNLRVRRLQCDEIWSFAGMKAKSARPEGKADGRGDIWTWVALDADTKLCVTYLVGGRDGWWAKEFMNDCANRIQGRVQIHRVYLGAVEEQNSANSPAFMRGCDMKVVSGWPGAKHVSTSENMAMRMGMPRFTRQTNGLSKKAENHAAIVAIHFMHYNFAGIHKALRVPPAMAAGLADHVWSLEEITLLAN